MKLNKVDEKLKLPIAKPPISYSGRQAYLLSVVLNEPKAWLWFFSSCIQMIGKQNGDLILIPTDRCPFARQIQLFGLKNKCFDAKKLIQYIVFCVCHKREYIMIELDDYYIPCKDAFHKKHHRHSSFIYGYDLKKELFYITGFNKDNVYGYSEIHFDDFVKGFKSKYNNNFKLFIYKLNKKSGYKFDFYKFKYAFMDFLSGKHSLIYQVKSGIIPNKKSMFFGINTYKSLQQLLIKSINNKTNNHFEIPIQKIQAFYEHKKSMCLRLEYVIKKGYLTDCQDLYLQYDLLSKEFLVIRNKLIKAEIIQENKIVLDVIEYLNTLYEKEKDMLEKIVKSFY